MASSYTEFNMKDVRKLKDVSVKTSFEVVLFVGLYILYACFVVTLFEVRADGFFCDDPSIAYNLKDETIPTGLMIFIIAAPMIIVLTAGEILIYIFDGPESGRDSNVVYTLCNKVRVHPLLVNLYYHLGGSGIGIGLTGVIAEAIKAQVGRLRPFFLAVCNPNMNITRCYDEHNLPRLVVEDVCQESDIYIMRDVRTSFPSGHGVTAGFLAAYVFIYIQAKIPSRLRIVKHFLQAAIAYLCIYVALTRVSDHYHHLSDVLVGLLFGVVGGVLTAVQYVPIFGGSGIWNGSPRRKTPASPSAHPSNPIDTDPDERAKLMNYDTFE